ncbi:MAG: hypothetical protein ACJAVS_001329, partial [Paracoccaceae bacterium]
MARPADRVSLVAAERADGARHRRPARLLQDAAPTMQAQRPAPPPRTHVFIIDGTLSSTEHGQETHAGALWRLLTEGGATARQSVGYHPGVQGVGLRRWFRAATGAGLNDAIRTGYGYLASHWRPGDTILLFGYSRGAYAARSLA